MIRLPFVKLSGAGNDFVLLDGSARNSRFQGPALARRLCSRRFSIGADGLLIARRAAPDGLPSLDYFNADGSRAFCGNGARCAAWWMHLRRWAGPDLRIRTISGPIAARVTGRERARLAMPPPKNVRLNLRLAAAGRSWTLHSLEAGAPHAVVEVRGLGDFPVAEAGRALRRHPAFGPRGTNVNFIEAPGRGRSERFLRVRTFERGVEDETLACGTGALAAAFCAYWLRGIPSPIRILTRGKEALTAGFDTEDGRLKEAWLDGPARITFQGEIAL